MSVTDGASIRRERILDMLQYIRNFMPKGISIQQVLLYMSMAHGLTNKTALTYINEQQQGGILQITNAKLFIRMENFKRLIELLAPDRSPETGERLSGGVNLALFGNEENPDNEASPDANDANKDLKKKKGQDSGVV